MRRLLALLPVLAVLLAHVSACNPAPHRHGLPSAPSASPSVQRSALRAGTSGDYPPLSTWKADHAEGFAPALLDAFAHASRFDLAWTRFRWPDLTRDLEANRFDVAADGITVRPERSVVGRFTVPIARGGAVLLLKRPPWAPGPSRSDPHAELQALDRPELRVVVNRGGHLERVTRRLFHAARIRTVDDNAGHEALARGDADAAMTNTFEAPRWAANLDGVEQLGPLTTDITALWVRADRADLAERLDAWLLDAERNGDLGQLRTRHLGAAGGGATALPIDAMLAATVERLGLMPFVAMAKRRAGNAVDDAGQEDCVLAAAREQVAKAAAKHGVPAPSANLVDAFFRAQIDAAKVVQRRVLSTDADGTAPSTAEFSLERDLRPAIARITERMSFLLVRIPRGVSRPQVMAQARVELRETGVDVEHVDQVADALSAFGSAGP